MERNAVQRLHGIPVQTTRIIQIVQMKQMLILILLSERTEISIPIETIRIVHLAHPNKKYRWNGRKTEALPTLRDSYR